MKTADIQSHLVEIWTNINSLQQNTNNIQQTSVRPDSRRGRRTWATVYTDSDSHSTQQQHTRKPSYRWQTRATWKSAKNCSNSTCLQRCHWRYWPSFMRLAVVVTEICEIPQNSLKIQTYGVQGHPRSSTFHPRSSTLVSMESPYVTSY